MTALRILHYMPGRNVPGGIASYLSRLVAAQQAVGHEVKVIGSGDELARGAADIVHAHEPMPEASGLPVVRHMHGHWPYCPSGSRFLARWGVACDRAYSPLGCAWGHVVDHCGSIRPARFAADFRRTRDERRMLSRVRTIAISQFVRSEMVRSGYDGSMIDVVYLPAPEVSVTDDCDRSAARFVFAGRLVAYKGCEWLLRAAAAAGAGIDVEVAGDGPQRAHLVKLAEKLGLDDRVRFHGWMDESSMQALMRQSRAVVFPSLWPEPAGLVTLESAAVGRAAIVSRIGGIPEYARACGHCILVEPADVAGLADAMRRLACDPHRADELGRTGAAAARSQFSMSAHLKRLDELYQRAIDGWS